MRRQAKAPFSGLALGHRSRGLIHFVFAIQAAIFVALVFATTTAFAGTGTTHDFTGSFDGSATPAGSFSSPAKMAIDQNSDTLYVLDVGNGALDKFDLSTDPPTPENFSALGTSALDGAGAEDCAGTPADCDETPQGSLGLSVDSDVAVDNSGISTEGNIYVSSESTGMVFAFDSGGTYLYTIDGSDTPTGSHDVPCGVAVDSTGEILISAFSAMTVRKFTPSVGSAAYQVGADVKVAARPCDLAIDSADSLYVNYYFNQPFGIDKFGPAGSSLGTVDPDLARAVTSDPSNDDVYVDHSGSISRYDDAGGPLAVFGSGILTNSEGIAVDGGTGRVYASDTSSNTIHVFGPISITLPDVIAEAPLVASPFNATLRGTIDPQGVPTSYYFEYRPKGAATWRLSTPVLTADAPQSVSADIGELESNTVYEARLIAENTDVKAFVTSEVVSFTTDSIAPRLLTSPAATVGETTATLYGKLIPGASEATSYHFEYGENENYGNTVPVPSGDAGTGNEPITLSEQIVNLKPNTTYHFRITASNPTGTTVGPDRILRTVDPSPPNDLPEGRVYEKVSPAEKNSTYVVNHQLDAVGRYYYQAASQGDAIIWASSGVFQGDGGAIVPQYISRRSVTGWTTSGLSPRQLPRPIVPNQNMYTWFSDDLAFGMAQTTATLHPNNDENGEWSLYVRRTGQINDVENSAFRLLVSDSYPFVIGASMDGQKIVFEAAGAPNNPGVYEWTNGAVRYLGPGGGGNGRRSFLVNPGINPVSADGTRIYFTQSDGLYVDENGSSRVVAHSEQTYFEAAKRSDGAVAFFRAADSLTPDSTADPSSADLYRWDAQAPSDSALEDLTTADPNGADVLGILGISNDASRLYFVARGKLAPGAVRGEPNVYLWEQGGAIRHVATLAESDTSVWRKQLGPSTDTDGARVTPDGMRALFVSTAQLTPYNTSGHQQIYLFDLEDEEIICVSCSKPAGSNADSYLSVTRERDGFNASVSPPRNLSSDGHRVFFESADALVPRDTNGTVDVYQWSNRRVQLISTGESGRDSTFMGASETGDDLFFATIEPLTRSDIDVIYDLYDARVDGIREPSPVPGCVGDECQGTPTPPLAFENPASSAISQDSRAGLRQRVRAKCRRGTKPRKGRCIRRKAHKGLDQLKSRKVR